MCNVAFARLVRVFYCHRVLRSHAESELLTLRTWLIGVEMEGVLGVKDYQTIEFDGLT
jgi:hypothetical protein